MPTHYLIWATIATLAGSAALTMLVRIAARRVGAVAQPKPDRWHSRSTAMMGGVAVFIAFNGGALLFFHGSRTFAFLAAAGALLFLAGLVDDFRHLHPPTKLALQIVAAVIAVSSGLLVHWTRFVLIQQALTVLWLVGITNAFNLLDNMDGLAGGIAVIACIFLAITNPASALLPLLLGAATLGFLIFNFEPASIFMGDCGSMFIGFSLGALALVGMDTRTRGFAPVLFAPIFLLMLPILDTSLVTFARLLAGRPVSRGGRDHTSHRLVALGLSERRAVLLLYGFATLCGSAGLLLRWIPTGVLFFLVPAFLLSIFFIGLHLGHIKVYAPEEAPKGAFRVLVDFSYKRRVMEISLDLFLMLLAFYGAFLLRFDGQLPADEWAIFLSSLPLVILAQLVVFLAMGMYRGIWRYIGIDDLLGIAKTVFLACFLSAATVLIRHPQPRLSLTVLILNALLLLLLVAASRLSFRVARGWVARLHGGAIARKPVLIYGAGERGARLVRSLQEYPNGYHALGFIDDNPQMVGRSVHGCRIASWTEVPELARRLGVEEVLISTAKIPDAQLDRLRAHRLTPIRVEAAW